jgi:hypothetical protein
MTRINIRIQAYIDPEIVQYLTSFRRPNQELIRLFKVGRRWDEVDKNPQKWIEAVSHLPTHKGATDHNSSNGIAQEPPKEGGKVHLKYTQGIDAKPQKELPLDMTFEDIMKGLLND